MSSPRLGFQHLVLLMPLIYNPEKYSCKKIKLDKFYKDLVHESDTFHLGQINIIVLHSNASRVNGSRASFFRSNYSFRFTYTAFLIVHWQS